MPATKTYTFRVLVEPDEDRWHAFCPALLRQGAATWGYTQAEARRNIDEVVRMVVHSLLEHGEPVPDEPDDLPVRHGAAQVAVSV